MAVKTPAHIKVIVAPNPSPMTASGTNTYVIGPAPFVVLDPGPKIDSHLTAILEATNHDVAAILVTHSHLDHSPLAKPLSKATGAKVFAFGNSFAGRSERMAKFATQGNLGGGEGVDPEFEPDITVQDGQILTWQAKTFEAMWTPGHFGNHLCFAHENCIFCGDHVMAWSTSLVSPPDGDLGAFMRSCQKLIARPEQLYLPGHGDPIIDGPGRTRWLMQHRQDREKQVLAELEKSPGNSHQLAVRIYADLNPALRPAASRNVLAHLLDLEERGRVETQTQIHSESVFRLIEK